MHLSYIMYHVSCHPIAALTPHFPRQDYPTLHISLSAYSSSGCRNRHALPCRLLLHLSGRCFPSWALFLPRRPSTHQPIKSSPLAMRSHKLRHPPLPVANCSPLFNIYLSSARSPSPKSSILPFVLLTLCQAERICCASCMTASPPEHPGQDFLYAQ